MFDYKKSLKYKNIFNKNTIINIFNNNYIYFIFFYIFNILYNK